MKTKKGAEKIKKKKSVLDLQIKSGITKAKKVSKVKKLPSNGPVAETVKLEAKEQDETVQKQVSARQAVWNSYLKTFYEVEKLNRKQKEIMKFCSNKSLTPPRRKKRFLNFIRNCYANHAEFTDEQVDELFELLLQKFADFKNGSYTSSNTCDSGASKNKKKKLARAAAKANEEEESAMKVEVKVEEIGNVSEKVKTKKKKNSKLGKMDQDNDDN